MKEEGKKQIVTYYELSGTPYELGKQMAEYFGDCLLHIPAPEHFLKEDLKAAEALYEKYCPGLIDELKGYAEAFSASLQDVCYTWMSYLLPRCSGLIMTDQKMSDSHTKIFRNYEFSLEDEDLNMFRTIPKGKYTHVGGSMVLFGRSEGINECGLAVSMSSCGFPVSNMEGMRPPKVQGLQFWAVIRTLLENCKDVKEALVWLKEMPIGYNINLYLADANNHAVLFETMDGEKSYQEITSDSTRQYLCGTNHIAIPEFSSHEPVAMRNSIVRYQKLNGFASQNKLFSEEEVKAFFLMEYPEGMTTYYYEQWFGTIKTVVLDTIEKRYTVCWFGKKENGWRDYFVNWPEANHRSEMIVERKLATKDMFQIVSIN